MLIPEIKIFFRAPCPLVPAPLIATSNMLTFGWQFKVFLWKWPYRVLVGEVELSWVFEDEVLTLFPFWILVLQVNSEAFNVFNPCRDATATGSSVSPRQHPSFLFLCPHQSFLLDFYQHTCFLPLRLIPFVPFFTSFTFYTPLLTRSSFIPTFFLLSFLPFLAPSSSSIFPLFSGELISIAQLSKFSTVLVPLWLEVGFLGGHGGGAWKYLDINTGETDLSQYLVSTCLSQLLDKFPDRKRQKTEKGGIWCVVPLLCMNSWHYGDNIVWGLSSVILSDT